MAARARASDENADANGEAVWLERVVARGVRRARDASGRAREPRLRDVCAAVDEEVRRARGADAAARGRARAMAFALGLDVETTWEEKAAALERGAARGEARGAGESATTREMSSIEALVAVDDEAYLETTVGDGARVATPTGADSEGATLDDDESELIARALCEMNAIKRAFAAWRREAVKEKYRRAREREIESLCAFSTGRRARKMALAAIGAWRTNARKRVRLRAFAAKRARRELATTGRAVARAWARIARDDAARRLEAFRQTQTRRNRRAMLAAFNAWRSRARARVARESADVWRRIKLESTALDTWSAVARAWKSERRAIDAARLARQRYVKRSVTRVWRVRVIHAERRAERAVVAVKFSRWRRRVRDERRERERMRFASSYDDARVTVGAFARWCAVVWAAKEHRAELARAAKFHRLSLAASAFYAWRAATSQAKRENRSLKTRVFAHWRSMKEHASQLNARATFYRDSQAITFSDKYLDANCFAMWRSFVFAQRRRYAAMELADTWRVKRAFAPWRARIGAAHFSDDVENTAPPVAVGEIEWQRF